MTLATTATTTTPAPKAKGKRKATGKAAAFLAAHPNFAKAFVKGANDLTPQNYARTLAAGRAAGKAWLDGSDKPLVMMLRAAGIKVPITDKADRALVITQYRPLVKA